MYKHLLLINNLAIVVIWIDYSSASCFYGCLKVLKSPFIFFIYFILKQIVVTLIELLISSEVISLGSWCKMLPMEDNRVTFNPNGKELTGDH